MSDEEDEDDEDEEDFFSFVENPGSLSLSLAPRDGLLFFSSSELDDDVESGSKTTLDLS